MRIGIIGCGNMGRALARGLVQSGAIAGRQLVLYDVSAQQLTALAKVCRAAAAGSVADLAGRVDAMLLCVKPQDMAPVVDELAGTVTTRQLIITIAAGLPLRFYEQRLASGIPVVRVMPNAPAQVRQGMAVVTGGRAASERHLKLAEAIFQTVGRTVRLPESSFDLVTAISGSGPAYVYRFVEAMIAAADRGRLPKAAARLLAEQTVRGAVEMLQATGSRPSALVAQVASKGGTTERALAVLARRGFRAIIEEAIAAAAARSKALSKG